jgi:hypothetical protein
MTIASIFSILIIYGWLIGHLQSILLPLAVRLPLNGTPPELGGSLWPKPNTHEPNANYMYIHRDEFRLEIGDSLNECEKDIIKKMSAKYRNIFFPPKLAYDYPRVDEPILNSLEFKINRNTKLFKRTAKNLADCSKTHYPYITDTEEEACSSLKSLD